NPSPAPCSAPRSNRRVLPSPAVRSAPRNNELTRRSAEALRVWRRCHTCLLHLGGAHMRARILPALVSLATLIGAAGSVVALTASPASAGYVGVSVIVHG